MKKENGSDTAYSSVLELVLSTYGLKHEFVSTSKLLFYDQHRITKKGPLGKSLVALITSEPLSAQEELLGSSNRFSALKYNGLTVEVEDKKYIEIIDRALAILREQYHIDGKLASN